MEGEQVAQFWSVICKGKYTVLSACAQGISQWRPGSGGPAQTMAHGMGGEGGRERHLIATS